MGLRQEGALEREQRREGRAFSFAGFGESARQSDAGERELWELLVLTWLLMPGQCGFRKARGKECLEVCVFRDRGVEGASSVRCCRKAR